MGFKLENESEIPKSPAQVISPDDQLVVAFTEMGSHIDKTIRAKLLTRADMKFIASLGKAQFAAFSPDSRLILTISPEGRARLFNDRGELLRRFRHPEKVSRVEFRNTLGALLLTLNDITWAVRDFGVRELPGHQAPVVRVAFASPENRTLILTSTQRDIARLWDMFDGQLLAEVTHPFPNKAFNTTFARFSPTGQYFLTWSDQTAEDGYPKMTMPVNETFVRIWNLRGEPIGSLAHQGMIIDLVISPDGEYILTLPDGAGPMLWHKDGRLLRQFDRGQYFYGAAFVPERQQFLTSKLESMRATGELWDLDGHLLRTFPMVNDPSGLKGFVANPQFSPDGLHFLSYDYSQGNYHSFTLWHLDEGLVRSFPHEDRVFSAVFSPGNNRHILSASADGTARLWSAEGDLLQSLKHEGPVYSARFSPDGQLIATASADGTAKLWDLDGNLLADLNKHAGEVYSAAFSPDGRFICTGAEDGSARLWPTPHTIRAWLEVGGEKAR